MDEIGNLVGIGVATGEAIQRQHTTVGVVVGGDVAFIDQYHRGEPWRKVEPSKETACE